jgi:hypothetical protein
MLKALDRVPWTRRLPTSSLSTSSTIGNKGVAFTRASPVAVPVPVTSRQYGGQHGYGHAHGGVMAAGTSPGDEYGATPTLTPPFHSPLIQPTHRVLSTETLAQEMVCCPTPSSSPPIAALSSIHMFIGGRWSS